MGLHKCLFESIIMYKEKFVPFAEMIFHPFPASGMVVLGVLGTCSLERRSGVLQLVSSWR